MAKRAMKRSAQAVRFSRGVAARVRGARKQAGLSQGSLARGLGIDVPAVSKLEAGKRDLRMTEVFEIARLLGVEPKALLDVVPAVHGKNG